MEEALSLLDVGDDINATDHAQQAFNRWVARGDGIAVYQNVDLAHSEVGHRKFVSFGGPDAQIPGEPPEAFPVSVSGHWAYRLEAVVPRGAGDA